MATTPRRAIGASTAGAQAPAFNPKAADPVVDPAASPDAPPPAPSDQIEPVDVNSPDYQAGYQNTLDGVDSTSASYKAGVAAAKGEMGGSAPDAPADAPPAARRRSSSGRPATLSELKELSGGNSEFVFEQLEANATLAEATAASVTMLRAQLNSEKAARAKAEKALAAETQSPSPVRTAGGKVADPKAAAYQEAVESGDVSIEGASTFFRPSYGR